jgi:hypothetical protein
LSETFPCDPPTCYGTLRKVDRAANRIRGRGFDCKCPARWLIYASDCLRGYRCNYASRVTAGAPRDRAPLPRIASGAAGLISLLAFLDGPIVFYRWAHWFIFLAAGVAAVAFITSSVERRRVMRQTFIDGGPRHQGLGEARVDTAFAISCAFFALVYTPFVPLGFDRFQWQCINVISGLALAAAAIVRPEWGASLKRVTRLRIYIIACVLAGMIATFLNLSQQGSLLAMLVEWPLVALAIGVPGGLMLAILGDNLTAWLAGRGNTEREELSTAAAATRWQRRYSRDQVATTVREVNEGSLRDHVDKKVAVHFKDGSAPLEGFLVPAADREGYAILSERPANMTAVRPEQVAFVRVFE